MSTCEPTSSGGLCRAWQRLALTLSVILASSAPLWAQPPKHRLYRTDTAPPGLIGQQQMVNPRLRGYIQPVELQGPEGTYVSIALGEAFSPSQQGRLKAGLAVGGVYLFKIGGLPRLEEIEVFPSIEIIDRLHPPAGLALRFPIPVQVTREEIEAAAAGRLITRVVYVENPRTAVPVRQTPGEQPFIDVRSHEDPLEVADRLGRPVAILRLGSRIPDLATIQQLSSACPLPILYGPEDELPLENAPEAAPAEMTPNDGPAMPLPPDATTGLSGRVAPAGHAQTTSPNIAAHPQSTKARSTESSQQGGVHARLTGPPANQSPARQARSNQ